MLAAASIKAGPNKGLGLVAFRSAPMQSRP